MRNNESKGSQKSNRTKLGRDGMDAGGWEEVQNKDGGMGRVTWGHKTSNPFGVGN